MTKRFTDFIQKTLLSDQEMATIERDLRVRPADPNTAQTLTAEQVTRFNRDGYVLPLPFFSAEEIEDFRTYFDQLLDQTLANGADSFSLVDAQLSHSRIYDLMFDPRLLSYVQDLVGEHLVCWSTHCFCKLPRNDQVVAWHQDAYYWPFTPARTVTVWLAIDDADRHNACMQFVKGSHLLGKIPHRLSREEEKNALRVTVEGNQIDGEIADAALSAGQISLHADTLLHGSGPNQSDRRRCGLTLRYVDASVTDLRDWSQCGVLVQGEDTRGHWGNPPRPEQE